MLSNLFLARRATKKNKNGQGDFKKKEQKKRMGPLALTLKNSLKGIYTSSNLLSLEDTLLK